MPAIFVAACSAGELVLPAPPESASATALHRGVRLAWEPIEGADHYVVQVSSNATFSGARTLDDLDAPTLTIPDLDGGPWYFRISVSKDGFLSTVSDSISALPLSVGTAGLVPLEAVAWTLSNGDPAAHFGFPAVGAGDIDGDGFDDLLVGAMDTTAGGTAFLYRGGPGDLLTQPDWQRASTLTSADFAKGLSSPGDVNGDGFRDLLIGAAEHDVTQTNEGKAWLYPGTGDATFFSDVESWSAESGQAFAFMGRFAAPAGDVNGDGYDDFAVSQHGYDAPSANEGRICVWYGTSGPLPTAADYIDDPDQNGAQLSSAISPRRGDADADGYDDLLTGAYLWNNGATGDAGAAFLYRGGPAGLEDEPSWMQVGELQNNQFGGSLSFVGDVNGDGFDDAIVGAYLFGMDDHGRAYLYTGGPGGLSTSAVWTYDGVAQEYLGMGVGAAGDVNGDGFDDILVGANESDAAAHDAGRVLLFLGSPSGPAATPSWEWLGPDEDGWAGGTVASAGDVNGDLSGDFAVGVVSFENYAVVNGKVRVFFGPPREGPTVTLTGMTGSFTDPAARSSARCTWDWGDATAQTVVDPCPPANAGAPLHDYGANGTYVVRLRVDNEYGLFGEAFSALHVLDP